MDIQEIDMKVIIIDDHPVVRQGIKSILECEQNIAICGEAEEGNRALKLVGEFEPDLAIVDIELKGNINGIELVKAIKERYPHTKTLVMSMDDGTLYAEQSIKTGARGFIAKEEASENIVEAINIVMSGEIYLGDEISKKIAKRHLLGLSNGVDLSTEKLTVREFEIFKLIGQGYKRGEIAKEINININTVESHRRKIKEKLNMTNSADLSKFAVKWFAEKKSE